MKKLLSAAALAAFAISGHAALENRDMNHDGITDAFYDRDRDITWLRDANYALTSGADHDGALDGKMTWSHANAWANSLTIDRYSGWRLPTTEVDDRGCTGSVRVRSFGMNCAGSEMGHLFYTELGNQAVLHVDPNNPPITKWGQFLNTAQDYYMSSTLDPNHTNTTWAFSFLTGFQGQVPASSTSGLFLLVRNGDVSPAPEPETYAMLLAGLGVMGAVARRRKAQQA